MNKLLKGSIAGAAGVALLLGGAGTFALWNDTATAEVGTVASGTLTIDAPVAGTWKDVSADGPVGGTSIDLSTYAIVPGDSLELTQDVLINATGDNLEAILSINGATITTSGATGDELLSQLELTLAASGPGVDSTAVGPNEFTVAPSATQTTVTLTLTVELPSTVSGVVAQGGAVDLSELGFTLTQTRP